LQISWIIALLITQRAKYLAKRLNQSIRVE
jgi:hypothetical protein